MAKKRFTEEQIIGILKEGENGANIGELCRRHEISMESYYRWRRKYRASDLSRAEQLRRMEEENRRLKQLVAELALDKQVLQELLQKK
jgi:putative transposase